MPLIVNRLPKREDKVITMGQKESQRPAAIPPLAPTADVEEKPIREVATTPPVVRTAHKQKKTIKPTSEPQLRRREAKPQA